MARDRIELAPTPVAEDCAQVGSPDYHERARKECRAFIEQLRRQFGPEPEGARLLMTSHPHDFGAYHEVSCSFDDGFAEAADYAFKLDHELPEYWDDEARAALGLPVPAERD